MKEVILGIDLGGTNVKVAAVTRGKNVLGKDSRPTHAIEGPEVVLGVIRDSVNTVLASAGVSMDQVMAVGVGCPGPLNWKTGVVYETPNMPGWERFPLAANLGSLLGIQCYVDNDANVACYGEYWLGAAQGTETVAVLTLGTGVGGGLVVDGKLLRGIDGTAAELGHMKVQRDGRECGCGGHGCLEAYASVTGMVRTAQEGIVAAEDSVLSALCEGDPLEITGKLISEAADQGDAYATSIIDETGRWIGLGVATLINALNPEMVVLCGGMIEAGDRLLTPIRKTAEAESFETPYKRCRIVPAGLGPDSGVLGAAGCALVRYERGSR